MAGTTATATVPVGGVGAVSGIVGARGVKIWQVAGGPGEGDLSARRLAFDGGRNRWMLVRGLSPAGAEDVLCVDRVPIDAVQAIECISVRK